MTFLYFVKPVGQAGPIKIGHSVNPARRVRELACEVGRKLQLVAQCPARRIDESYMHWRHRHHHLCGEWFEPTPRIMADAERAAHGILPSWGRYCIGSYAARTYAKFQRLWHPFLLVDYGGALCAEDFQTGVPRHELRPDVFKASAA